MTINVITAIKEHIAVHAYIKKLTSTDEQILQPVDAIAFLRQLRTENQISSEDAEKLTLAFDMLNLKLDHAENCIRRIETAVNAEEPAEKTSFIKKLFTK